MRITEKQLLRKLNIPDWRHMTKGKILQFVNNMSYLDPEVAKAALSQFPNFSELGIEIVKQLGNSLQSLITSKNQIDSRTFDSYERILDYLNNLLEKDYLSSQERQYVISSIVQVSNNIAEVNKSHNALINDTIKAVSNAASLALVIGGSILGVTFWKKR